MVQLTADGDGAMAGAAFDIVVDDMSGDIASARVVFRDHVDCLHLVGTPQGSRIANVVFHARD